MYTKKENPIEELRRLQRFKSVAAPAAVSLGDEMLGFFNQSVAKRQNKFVKLAENWAHLVPQLLCEHCALEGFTRGTLTVTVDSSSHLYELKQLLLAGLEKQLLMACKTTGLRKITLRPGQWYEADPGGDRKIKFK
jgi:hypothetical protein